MHSVYSQKSLKFYKIILHFPPQIPAWQPKCSLSPLVQLFPSAHSLILPPAFVPIIVLRVHIRWPDLKPKEGDFLRVIGNVGRHQLSTGWPRQSFRRRRHRLNDIFVCIPFMRVNFRSLPWSLVLVSCACICNIIFTWNNLSFPKRSDYQDQ